jgi:uncharacterized protein YjbJ (UPF0337 family)
MNEEQLKGKWNQVKGKFKQRYANVTDDDVTFAEGKFDEMLGRLQEKTGKRKEQLKRENETWQPTFLIPYFKQKRPLNSGAVFA